MLSVQSNNGSTNTAQANVSSFGAEAYDKAVKEQGNAMGSTPPA